MGGNNFPKHKRVVPSLCARLYTQIFKHTSFPRGAWEREFRHPCQKTVSRKHLRIKTSAPRGNHKRKLLLMPS